MVNVLLGFFIMVSIGMFVTNMLKSKRIKILEETNKKLALDNIKVVGDNKKITLEYLALKDMWTRLEKQANQMMSKMGKSMMNFDFNDIMDSNPYERTKTFDVDEILNEINEKGIDNLSKEKMDFLKKNNIK